MKRPSSLIVFISLALALPLCAFADYGYFTMPVDPSSLSYSNGNAGINSWVDHTSPQNSFNDNSSTMTRYDGMQFFGTDAALATCTLGVGCYNGHEGIDYAVGAGTRVLAAASGTVKQAQWQDPNNTSTGFGIFVRIWHSQYNVSTLYAHLSATTTTALAGSNVARGQFIGSSGCTGACTGNHLHFQTYDANDTITATTSSFADGVDPYGYSGPGGLASDSWANDKGYGYMWASKNATSSVYATTTNNQTMTASTTWLENRIYIVKGNLTIASSVTLSIQDGAVVKFDSATDVLQVNGTLNVSGTAANPVYFTSIKDDTVGGDMNDDATATVPGKNDWSGIQIGNNATATINSAVIRYAGSGSTYNADIADIGGNLTISNSTIGSSSIRNLYISSGTVSVSNTTFVSSTYGIYADNIGTLTLSSDTFDDNSLAGGFPLASGFTFTASGDTAIGPGERGFRVWGSIGASQTWVKDLPYIIDNGQVGVASGRTLTINSGTIIKSILNDPIAVTTGTLNVQGVSSSPVYFTSLKDDSIGGDTNADATATTPAKGDWQGIEIDTSASATINNAIFSYGGDINSSDVYVNGGVLNATGDTFASSSQYGVQNGSGTSTITHSTISNSKYGIFMGGGSVTVSTSTFANNTIFGMDNNTAVTSTASAINNYWNASSGPHNANLNPNGTGDNVSDHVSFVPWLTTAP